MTIVRDPQHRRRHAGTTMIEVLVAILVLSIGMLGIAGMQSASMRFAQGGWARGAVASGLSDLADRVRANPSSTANAYQLADDYPTQRSALAAGTVAAGTDCEASGASCAPAQLADFHLTQWRLLLNTSMPGSAGYVTGTRDTGYQATVMWFDKSFLQKDGSTLDASKTCAAADTEIAARVCCPAAVNAIPGVRCTNMVIVP